MNVRSFLHLLGAGLLVCAAALAQTAQIGGTVTDPTGGRVPGASVTATNTETNFARSVTTDVKGQYLITPLPPGPYKIVAEVTGFKPGIAATALSVNEVARIDLRIQLGVVVGETVEVTALAPIIEKDTSFIGTVVDRQQVEDLPLNGRNFTQLTTLSPGVTRGTPGSNAAGQSGDTETFRYGEFGGAAISVNGLREQFNTFLLDGIDNNETLVNNIAYIPSPEVIQEFRVITTNAPAEFGRAGGAIQNIITRSGTNDFHGSAYYFLRPEGLAATPTFATTKPEFKNQDFGATFGGPIVKDKTFFFLSWHGLKSSIPVEAGGTVTVPTALMRQGNFSELLNAATSGITDGNGRPVAVQIYDPATGLPYPGNIIPASQINPVAQRYLNVFPSPDTAGVVNNYHTHRQKESTFNDFDARLDHSFSTEDQLFLRASVWRDGFSDPGRIPGYQAGFGSGDANNKGYQIGLGETHVFSPSLINEFRAGWMSFRYEFLPVGFGTDQNAALGIPGPGGVTVANGLSLIGGGNGHFIEYLGDFGQYQIEQKSLQVSDAVTLVSGAHNFKFGGTAIRRQMAQTRTQYGKGFYFYSDFLATPGNTPALGQTGYEVADMLVGRTNFTATGNPGYVPRNVISWENSLFVQDDWRVTDKLTLNLGLRWDVFTPYYEEDNKLANYDPATRSIVLPEVNGVPRSTVDTDWNNLGPRIGFAYQLGDKTALRGSYGIFYSVDRGGIDNQLTENPPSVVSEFRFGGPGTNVRLSDPIPLPTPVNPANPELPQGSGLVYVPRDNPTTRVQQYSVSLQHELASDTAVMLAYVGTRGDNLTALLSRAGFAGNVADRLTVLERIGISRYNALQAQVRRSDAHGLSVLASYTLGFAKDNVPSLFSGSPSRGAAVTDPNCKDPLKTCNLDLDYGYADFDVRHRFTLAASYELPFFEGDRILGGWSVNSVVTLQSGSPFTVYAGFDGSQRANVSGDPNDGPGTEDRWFNTAAFSAPASGAQGNSERNSVRGPGLKTVDVSIFKTFNLGGDKGLELRIEGFNIFDTPQYTQPNNVLADGNFGKITQTRLNSERQIQIAARLKF